MTPTGISVGCAAVLAIVSHIIIKAAPPKYEKGRSILWSEPTISLMQWGIIRPTNPIVPLTDTLAATRIALIIINIFYYRIKHKHF